MQSFTAAVTWNNQGKETKAYFYPVSKCVVNYDMKTALLRENEPFLIPKVPYDKSYTYICVLCHNLHLKWEDEVGARGKGTWVMNATSAPPLRLN